MKIYRPKGKIQAEFIEGSFVDATGREWPEGAYHQIKDGVASYISKEDFEANNEPSKKSPMKKVAAPTKKKSSGGEK